MQDKRIYIVILLLICIILVLAILRNVFQKSSNKNNAQPDNSITQPLISPTEIVPGTDAGSDGLKGTTL